MSPKTRSTKTETLAAARRPGRLKRPVPLHLRRRQDGCELAIHLGPLGLTLGAHGFAIVGAAAAASAWGGPVGLLRLEEGAELRSLAVIEVEGLVELGDTLLYAVPISARRAGLGGGRLRQREEPDEGDGDNPEAAAERGGLAWGGGLLGLGHASHESGGSGVKEVGPP